MIINLRFNNTTIKIERIYVAVFNVNIPEMSLNINIINIIKR